MQIIIYANSTENMIANYNSLLTRLDMLQL